jgi:tRNA A-37 threonylcarbamoyl transferase component Bud32
MTSALLEVNDEAMQLIGHGAEGKVFATIFLSRPTIVKERVSKKYRVRELDQRLIVGGLEFSHQGSSPYNPKSIRHLDLTHAENNISIYLVDQVNKRLYMERIAGDTVKDILRSNNCGGKLLPLLT